MLLEERTVLETAIETYGKHAQIDKSCEEMSELIGALMRYRCTQVECSVLDKCKSTEDADAVFAKLRAMRENILEEIADVEIMLAQLKMIYDNNDVERIRARKLRRLASRLHLT